MKRAIAMIMTAALAPAACGDDTHPPAAKAVKAACDSALETALGAWADAGFSGSIAVSTGGELDCLAAYGSANEDTGTPNTVETVFSIGSVGKAFTAAAVLDLADAGKLSLDDRAGKLVPGARRTGGRRYRRAAAPPHERADRVPRFRPRAARP
jgi:CubicO group peptidase (beta-lactamase class C family)